MEQLRNFPEPRSPADRMASGSAYSRNVPHPAAAAVFYNTIGTGSGDLAEPYQRTRIRSITDPAGSTEDIVVLIETNNYYLGRRFDLSAAESSVGGCTL